MGLYYGDGTVTYHSHQALLGGMVQGCTVHTWCELDLYLGGWYRDVQFTLRCGWVFTWEMVQGCTVHTWCEWVFNMGDGTGTYSSHFV